MAVFDPILQRRLYKDRELIEYTRSLSSYLPTGRATESRAVIESSLFMFLQGISGQIKVFGDLVNFLTLDYWPPSCVSLLPEWERALGIPDGCFSTNETLDLRRRQILVKLALIGGVVTRQHWEDIGFLLIGKRIRVLPGVVGALGKFDIIIELPIEFNPFVFPHDYLFPVIFSSNLGNTAQCFFDRIKPAHTKITYNYVGDLP